MLGFYVSEDSKDRKRNWMPRQTTWRVDDDHSLKRMTFESAFYGLHRDNKYNMLDKIHDWYGWHNYFSWRDLPRDCTQLMHLYVSEIWRIGEQLTGQPARCVSILLRADQEQIVPVRVEQAGALLGIYLSIPNDDKAEWRECLQSYISTRPDFEMQGAAFRITEVGAANFAMKMMSSGMIPGFDRWHNMVQMNNIQEKSAPKKARPEGQRNLLENLVFDE